HTHLPVLTPRGGGSCPPLALSLRQMRLGVGLLSYPPILIGIHASLIRGIGDLALAAAMTSSPGSIPGMTAVYRLARLPLAITGPVRCPGGGAPGGSTGTAEPPAPVRLGRRVSGTLMRTGFVGSMSPSECGLSPGGISHSSNAFCCLPESSAAGTMVRLSPPLLTATTKLA